MNKEEVSRSCRVPALFVLGGTVMSDREDIRHELRVAVGNIVRLKRVGLYCASSTAKCGAAGRIFQGGDVWPWPLVPHPDAFAIFDTEVSPGDYPSALCFVQLPSKSRKGFWENLPEDALQTLQNHDPVHRSRGRWHRMAA